MNARVEKSDEGTILRQLMTFTTANNIETALDAALSCLSNNSTTRHAIDAALAYTKLLRAWQRWQAAPKDLKLWAPAFDALCFWQTTLTLYPELETNEDFIDLAKHAEEVLQITEPRPAILRSIAHPDRA